MLHVFSFEKLNVWIDSKELVKMIYAVTRKFPEDEKFGLTSQLRRAAVSVASNLAEGSARRSAKDQAHFSQIAYSSLLEILTQLMLSNDLEFINEENLISGRTKIENLTMKVGNLKAFEALKI